MTGLPPTILYALPSVCRGVSAVNAALDALQQEVVPMDVRPFEDGQEAAVKGSHVVTSFPTAHTVPSQGYVVWHRKKRLKKEFAGASQDAIRSAAVAGETVSETVESPEVAFTGDTSVDFFTMPSSHAALRAKVLILECTFLDDSVDRVGAREKGHMHVDDIAENAACFKNQAILLMHFSARYRAAEILQLLDQRLPSTLRDRVYPWLQGFSLR